MDINKTFNEVKRVFLFLIIFSFISTLAYSQCEKLENVLKQYKKKEVYLHWEDEALQKSAQTITLQEDEILVFYALVNVSTGYSWSVDNYSKETLIKAEIPLSDAMESPENPGGQVYQCIVFSGNLKGNGEISLSYQRPWEKERSKANSAKIIVKTKGKSKKAFDYTPRPLVKPKKLTEEEYAVKALPSYFDWRDQGIVTPVKDQGSCGSCWAFGATAGFEAKIKKKDGVERDLSEQYLVSCNNHGFSCAGGWWAHDYWMNYIPAGEDGAGAVYEADFPYANIDAPCNAPHTHHEQLEGWAYVDDIPDGAVPTQNHTPTVAQIKEKLYEWGPIPTALTIENWGTYTGGVLSGHTNTVCDHIVLITGWDDANQCWIIKNSWGSTWGENGYIRIAYNSHLTGYYSTYLKYDKTNPRIVYQGTHFYESISNNGSIRKPIQLTLMDGGNFSMSSGQMSAGQHYNISSLPSGLSSTINVTSSTTAELVLNGYASQHLDIHDDSITVTFTNSAFSSYSASQVENYSTKLKVDFFDPYQVVYEDITDVTCTYYDVWHPITLLNGETFGLWYSYYYDPYPTQINTYFLETYTKQAYCTTSGTGINDRRLKALNYGDVIDGNVNYMVTGGSYGDQHRICNQNYTSWYGRTAYVGISFTMYGGTCYGWMQIQVSADGNSVTLLDYAYNEEPYAAIQAGHTSGSSNQGPIANFSANQTSIYEGGSVTFNDQSSYNPTNWSWSFNGGSPSSSSSQNPTVTYNTAGTYDVSLAVSNSYGSDSQTEYSYITVLQQVQNYCSSQGNDASYEWIDNITVGNFSNNSGSNGGYGNFTSQTASLSPGSSVSVNLTPGFSSSAYTEYWKIWIDFNGNNVFTDSGEEVFSGSGSSGVSGSFNVPSSASGTTRMRISMKYNGAPTSCESFTYGEVEDYTVEFGGSNPQLPVADFTASTTSIAVGESVSFSDQTTNNPTNWSWSFQGGNPSSSSSQNPNVTYNSEGTFNVTLTASNSAGSDTRTRNSYITVSSGTQVPVADFSASATSISVGESVSFSDLSSNNPTNWSWTFEGGSPSSSSSQNPSVTYNSEGTFYVSLTASNSAGSDTKTSYSYITVTSGSTSYCSVSHSNALSYYHIENVTLGSINNNSSQDGVSGYSNFTSISTSLTAGNTYSLYVTPTPNWSSNKVKAYIDWNRDGDFLDTYEEVMYTTGGNVPFMSSVYVPTFASGSTRMRVRLTYYDFADPCSSHPYGETEDYTINISPSMPNSGVLENGSAIIFPNPASDHITVTLKDAESAQVEIIRMNGEVIKKVNLTSSSKQINITDLAKGLYNVKVIINDKTEVYKVVIE